MLTRILLLVFWLVALVIKCDAQDIRLAEREPFEQVLEGLVDFDQTSASPLPGTSYGSRIPYPGLIADTYFMGQIPILKENNNRTYGANYGLPSSPLKEAMRRKGRYSWLHVVTEEGHDTNSFLISRVYEVSRPRRIEAFGFGTIALKFTDRQFVFGFDLKSVNPLQTESPVAKVQFFSIDGKTVGNPILLTTFGTFTFLTPDKAREVKGVEITNIGSVPIGIDTILFELTQLIG